jgi:aspartokinase
MQGIPGIAARAFGAIAAERASVLMISQASSENNICVVVRSEDAVRVVKSLRSALEFDIMKSHIDDVTSDDSIAVIAAVGDRMAGTPGIAAKVFAPSARKAGTSLIRRARPSGTSRWSHQPTPTRRPRHPRCSLGERADRTEKIL